MQDPTCRQIGIALMERNAVPSVGLDLVADLRLVRCVWFRLSARVPSPQATRRDVVLVSWRMHGWWFRAASPTLLCAAEVLAAACNGGSGGGGASGGGQVQVLDLPPFKQQRWSSAPVMSKARQSVPPWQLSPLCTLPTAKASPWQV